VGQTIIRAHLLVTLFPTKARIAGTTIIQTVPVTGAVSRANSLHACEASETRLATAHRCTLVIDDAGAALPARNGAIKLRAVHTCPVQVAVTALHLVERMIVFELVLTLAVADRLQVALAVAGTIVGAYFMIALFTTPAIVAVTLEVKTVAMIAAVAWAANSYAVWASVRVRAGAYIPFALQCFTTLATVHAGRVTLPNRTIFPRP
jgi:hypothetical protein